ncbi:hypothetical protein ABZ575_36725, partial [Streptomyces sp. NPDC018347]
IEAYVRHENGRYLDGWYQRLRDAYLATMADLGVDALYMVIINVAVNAWMAGHIHGEDGCTGCDGSRGPAGHGWEARMRTIIEVQPNITKWFDRDVWTHAVNDAGYAVTCR